MLIRESFLDDDRVVVERFGLRKQVADGDAFARAAHAEQDRVLRRRVAAVAGKRRHADEIALRSFVERLGVREMSGERGAERKHVGEIACLGVELSMPIPSPRPARPTLEKQFLRSRRQSAGEILRAVHPIDGVLDCRHLRRESFARGVPGADDVFDVEWHRVALHERRDFLLLLLHRGEKREPLLARVITGETVVRLLFASDLDARGQRLDVHCDCVIEQRQSRETLDESRMRDLRPATEHEDRVIESVHPETGSVCQSLRLAVPAIFLNGEFGIESLERIIIEAFGERWIQKCRAMPVMVCVLHGRDPRGLERRSASNCWSCSNSVVIC